MGALCASVLRYQCSDRSTYEPVPKSSIHRVAPCMKRMLETVRMSMASAGLSPVEGDVDLTGVALKNGEI